MSTSKTKNLIQRTITGILFVAIIVGGILWHPISFALLFAVITALSVYEFITLVNTRVEGLHLSLTLNITGGVYLFLATWLYAGNPAVGVRIFLPYLFFIVYLFIHELYKNAERPVSNQAYSLLCQIYVALPFALLNLPSWHPTGLGDMAYRSVIPLALFVFIWVNDTGAYCVGSLCGRYPLFKRVSPHKSWEGFIGGLVFTVISALVMARYFTILSLWEWIGFSLVVVVFGTWGDLTESLFKRKLHLKDSGTILPGHGGMMDRFDSALIAIPASVIYLYPLLHG